MSDQGYFEEDLILYESMINTLEHQMQYQTIEPSELENKSNIASYLRAKNSIMVKYLCLLNTYAIQKIETGIVEPSVVHDLLESKTLIQKMTQTQKKLQYQIDKLTRVVEVHSESDAEDDQVKMTYKPRLDNLVTEVAQPDQKYVAPKLSAVLSKKDKIIQKQERKDAEKKNQSKARLIRSVIGDQETDRPKTVSESDYQAIYYGRAEDERAKAKRLYEEETMTRLPVTKLEKRREKIAERKAETTHLDDFEEFETINSLVKPRTNKPNKPKAGLHKKSKLKGSLKKKFRKRK